MSKAVKIRLPGLYRVVKFLYGEPSQLLTFDDCGDICRISSSQGVRQGDPLCSLLFSMTISPFVKDLGQFAAQRKPLAYLDDIVLFTDIGKKQTVLNHLQSKEVFQRYNLRVNTTKIVEFSIESLREEPMKILGTHVGGTIDPNTNPATEKFVCEAAKRLRERVTVLEPLTIQKRLLLLRMCFFPVLNYLTRTIHPNLTRKGTEEFDCVVVVGTITSWLNTSATSLPSVSIIHLPTKHGGLDLFRQKEIRNLAFSSSVVLCQSVLRSRNIPLDDQTCDHLNEFIELCASNLGLPADNLIQDEHGLQPHLQRKSCEVLHERAWKDTYTKLSNTNRIRFFFFLQKEQAHWPLLGCKCSPLIPPPHFLMSVPNMFCVEVCCFLCIKLQTVHFANVDNLQLHCTT